MKIHNNKEINKNLTINEMFPECNVFVLKCIEPTKTLTKDEIYVVVLHKDRYRPSWMGDYSDSAYNNMYGVINDKNLYIEVSLNRFK